MSFGSICSLCFGGSFLSIVEMLYFLVIPILLRLPTSKAKSNLKLMTDSFPGRTPTTHRRTILRNLMANVSNPQLRSGPREAWLESCDARRGHLKRGSTVNTYLDSREEIRLMYIEYFKHYGKFEWNW